MKAVGSHYEALLLVGFACPTTGEPPARAKVEAINRLVRQVELVIAIEPPGAQRAEPTTGDTGRSLDLLWDDLRGQKVTGVYVLGRDHAMIQRVLCAAAAQTLDVTEIV